MTEWGSLVQRARQWALRQPDQPAYLFLADGEAEAARLTFRDLEARVRAVGRLLQSKGAQGERALLLYPPGLDFVTAFLACLASGVTAVPAYLPRSDSRMSRLDAIVHNARPRLVLTTAALRRRFQARAGAVAGLAGLPLLGTDELAPELAQEYREPEIGPATLAFLQYTSGSTATPKGVMISHGNLVHNQQVIQQVFRQDPASRVVSWLPLYHDMGLIGTVLQPLWAGSTCILMPPLAFLQKPIRWLEVISRFAATTSGGPNFAYELCADKISAAERQRLDLSSWEVAFNGAEPVRWETLERFARAFEPCGFRREALSPCYGLAEATLMVSGRPERGEPVRFAASPAALEAGRVKPATVREGGRALVGCGQAVAGQILLAVDPQSREVCSDDRIGEIWLSGPSVGQGYWDRPDETQRVFRAHLADGTGPFLRTGDLGFLRGGELFVAGRLKDLIIIRGRNLYPQDIELAAERSHPELKVGGGAAFTLDYDGEERLGVVHEVVSRRPADPEGICRELRRAVAEEHQIQIQVVVLIRAGTLPRTSSGKVQRHACRSGHLDGSLAVVWTSALGRDAGAAGWSTFSQAELVGLDPVQRHQALLALLGEQVAALTGLGAPTPKEPLAGLLDSLAAVELKASLEGLLRVEVPLAGLLSGGGTEELCAGLLAALENREERGAEPAGAFAPSAAPAGADLPLSVGQEALWFLERLTPQGGAYNIAVAARCRLGLNAGALRRALVRLVARHSSLRTTFHEVDGAPVQRVRERPEIDWLEEDAAGWSEPCMQERLAEDAWRSFDLEVGPLLRVRLWACSDGEWTLLLVVHHLVADFRSLAVLSAELGALYQEEGAGWTAELPPLTARYPDYVRWQRERLAGLQGERLWRYWSQRLAGPPPDLDLPLDRPRPRGRSSRGGAAFAALPAELAGRLRELASARGVTLFVTLLAAWQAQLSRYSGQEDFAVASPAAGRDAPELADLVGYLVNPVVLRADLSSDPTVGELLARVRRTVAEALEHASYPVALLAERLRPVRDLARPPLFQTMLVWQATQRGEPPGLAGFSLGEAGARVELGGLVLESLRIRKRRRVQLDLTLRLAELGGGLGATLEYSSDLFDDSSARRMLGHFRTLLAAFAAAPEQRVSTLPLLTAGERSQLLREWNATGAATHDDLCLHQLFEAQAERTPEAEALVDGSLRLTYRELNRQANRLAHLLLRLGVEPEDRVGVCLGRSAGLVATLLGVLKAGGAYVPLDPAYPEERLGLLAADSGARLLLVEGAAPQSLAGAGRHRVVDLASAVTVDAEGSLQNPGSRSGPGNLAYLIYTSGSTGGPKAVAIEHRSPVALLRWACATFTSEEFSGVLAGTSVGFDLSVFEIFAPLSWGGRVILAENALHLPALPACREVTLINTVPSAMAELVRSGGLPGGKFTVNLAGEPISPALLEALLETSAVRRVLNLYGPSEDTTYSTCAQLGWPQACGVPIGRPLTGKRVYLLDRGGEPVPAGVPGEFFLGGEGLARGYLGRPGLTAERFCPDPWSGDPGARLYRTGDLARYRTDGTLDFLGRIDHQVKVRGFRVEPGEVENALLAHPAVADAAALAIARGEDRHLVAYAVPRAGAEPPPSPTELRAFLRRQLPEFMIPSVCMILPALPRTPNGKLDRRSLPAPWAAAEPATIEVDRSPIEEILAGILGEVLGLAANPGPEADFFALGGHSLRAAQVLSRVHRAFGIELPLPALFEHPTVAGLASRIEAALGAGTAPGLPRIERASRQEKLPLSFAQQRLWLSERLAPDGPLYVIPVALRMSGRLDLPAFTASLSEIVRRHEALRTRFVAVDGEPFQIIDPPAPLAAPLVDLSRLPGGEGEARRLIRQEASRPFDLERGPLLRMTFLRLAPDQHLGLLTLHHIAADGWSLGVLVRELSALYEARHEGRLAALPELRLQYADFARWQRQWLRDEVLAAQLQYWREQLEGALPVLELPGDRPRPASRRFRGVWHELTHERDLRDQLEALGRHSGTTLFMVLLAAFQVLLHRYTGLTDLAVGTDVANRRSLETESLIGFFVNQLVLRADLSRGPSFVELLGRVRAYVLGAYAHQDLPFEKLVEALRPERSTSSSPLFQVKIVLQNAPLPSLVLPGLAVSPVPAAAITAQFDLLLNVEPEDGGGLKAAFVYDADLFEAATITRLGQHWRALLQGASRTPDVRLGAVSMLSDEESSQVLREWNDTRAAAGPLLHELVASWAARAPETLAVVCGEKTLTYAELDLGANRLARHLSRLGVGPEVLVGVATERSPDMVIAILAVLKAGGAFLPLDPSYPAERLRLMLEDSGILVLLTQERLTGSLPFAWGFVIRLDSDWEEIERESAEPFASGLVAENLAYAIYTSGSTGRPKGALLPHRGLANLATAQMRRFDVGPGARILQFSPQSFDASVWEIAMALGSGATLHLAPREELLPGPGLSRLLRQRGISSLTLPPSALAVLPEGDYPSLATLIVAGEACPSSLAQRWSRGRRFFNAYGPTEATVCATVEEVGAGAIAIGRPIANAEVCLLGPDGEAVPIGVAGELCVGGPGLARGYLGRPELTAERFVPHPCGAAAGERLYRTGDLARWLPEGRVDFLGRMDQQVKVRGFRIEPGEVESALLRHPAVREAAVSSAREDEGLLAAWVVVDPSAGFSPAELKKFLGGQLPEYMIPAVLVPVESLPLTPSGKVDRQALALPVRIRSDQEAAVQAPQSPVAEIVAAVWGEVLRRDRVDPDDHFFEAGGHSLSAAQVISRIGAVFGVEPPLRALFDSPTLAGFTERIETMLRGGEAFQAPPILPGQGGDDGPLSFAQQRLWFIHQLDPDNPAYNIPMAVRLSGRLSLPALAASLGEIVRRHDAFRTRFFQVRGEPRQKVESPSPVELPLADLTALPEPAEAAALFAAAEARRPFDLARRPLWRAVLLRLAAEDHVVLLTLHHVIADGWSLGVFVRELTALYSALAASRPPRLPELPVQYRDFAVWQRQWLQGEVLDAHRAYWRQKLAGELAMLALPLDRPRPSLPSYRGADHSFTLPTDLQEELRSLSRREGATLFMALLAGFKAILHRYTGQDDMVIGTVVANRTHAQTEGLIGCFVNALVLRTDLSGKLTFLELLRRVRETALGAFTHQDLPFERLVEELAPERNLSHSPIFQVRFTLDNNPLPPVELVGLELRPFTHGHQTSKFDLTLTMTENGGRLSGVATYRTELFNGSTIERLCRQYGALLAAAVRQPDAPLDWLRALAAEETEARPASHEASHRRFRAVRPEAVPLDLSLERRDSSPENR